MHYQIEELKKAIKTGKPIEIFPEYMRWIENVDCLLVNLGEAIGRLPFEEISFEENEVAVLSKARSLFRRSFFVSVIGEKNNEFVLSVNQFVINTLGQLKVGEYYEGEIKEVTSFGLFVMVKETTVFVHKSEVSKCYIDDLKAVFKRGMKTRVKILVIENQPPYKIIGSRKLAYPKNNIHIGDIVEVLLIRQANFEGFVCEVTPNLQGIMDAMPHRIMDMEIGDKYYAIVKEINLKGAKLDMVTHY